VIQLTSVIATGNKFTFTIAAEPLQIETWLLSPSPIAMKFCHQNTRVYEKTLSKNFAILGVAVLIQCQGVTDGQTDRQPPIDDS